MDKLKTILTNLDLSHLLPVFREQEIDESLLHKLTDEDLRELGVDKLGNRKKLLEAFTGIPSATPVTPDPTKCTKESPFVNSLDLQFVPFPGYRSLICTSPLRVCDYQKFCSSTGEEYPPCDFTQGSDHPVVNITWEESGIFCRWLTKLEQDCGNIPRTLSYRIPYDLEWSAAVCLPYEQGGTPKDRSGKAQGYPWQGSYPPPPGSGNYHPLLAGDGFKETAPVCSFAPNQLGIYDLGGNVWEWCLEEYEPGCKMRVLRGASCFNNDEEYLMSSFRDKCAQNKRRNNNGMRLVLSRVHEKDPWF